VTFDYPRQRMILEPNEHFAEAFEGDMSGIGMRLGPAESKAILVEWVEPGSPAAQAGLAPDDLIEAFDGAPVLSLGIPRMRELFRSEAKTYRLSVLRAGTRLEIPITTRRMI